MEGFVVLDTENNVAIGDKPNIQKATKASFANAARQKLGDISNLPQQTRTLTQEDKSQFMPISTNDYINQLQKENKALLKIIGERNCLISKLIEVTGVELKKLRINLQKMQQQNLQLAQSNSQMLAELNSGKDRLKALQHELGCQNCLLKAKNLEMQENLKVKNCKILHDECIKVKHTSYDSANDSKVGIEDDKLGNTKWRPQSKIGLGSSQQVGSKDRNDNKRPCTRRQSSKFERGELQPADDFFPDEDIRTSECHPSNDSLKENGSTSVSMPFKDEEKESNDATGLEVKHERPCVRRRSARLKPEEPKPCEELVKIAEEKISVCLERKDEVEKNGLNSTCSLKIEEKEGISAPVQEAQDFGRCSLSRPSRQAAKKVQTYKEVPLNVKMRRTE